MDVRYRTQSPPAAELAAEYDLVVACDGVRSATRAAYADTFAPDLDERSGRYMWLGTDKVFEAFTFIVDEQDFGTLQVHAYPYDATRSTFIVEMTEDAWRRAGFEEFADRDHPPGTSDEDSIRRCEALLADHLDGRRLIPNNSKWLRFTTVRNKTWRHENVVLLGDAAHTAHFSIGSGTKLAMEDALVLAASLHEHPDVPTALAAYEDERRPVVESTQRAAQASLEWFEHIDRYTGQDPHQFAFNLLTRSRRVTYDNLRVRDEGFTTAVNRSSAVPPMFRPYQLGGLLLRNRVVVPPTALHTARDGVPGDFDLVHLSTQAIGGAGLVLAGMTAVSADGRATPAAPDCGTTNRRRPGGASPTSSTVRPTPASASSSPTPDAARPPTAAASRSPPRRCPGTSAARCRARPTGPTWTHSYGTSWPRPGGPTGRASTRWNSSTGTGTCCRASCPR